jgi:hypothetical protein
MYFFHEMEVKRALKQGHQFHNLLCLQLRQLAGRDQLRAHSVLLATHPQLTSASPVAPLLLLLVL